MPKKKATLATPPHVILTPQGREKLSAELTYLKEEKRPAITKRIAAAKELGDLSENAEYADAKDEQAFAEARVAELENILKYAEIVTPHGHGDAVAVGATVTVRSAEGERTYTLVGMSEADPAQARISHESPLGRALLGKHPGDAVRFDTPRGSRELTVIAVAYHG
jgi:transcription elongation factor GreA